MIEKEALITQAVRIGTGFRNVMMEYLQHLFLGWFYQQAGSEEFLFKGGTALRLLYGSSRFSEDLDFSGLGDSSGYEKILTEVLAQFSLENIKTDFKESKPTSGGHLAIVSFGFWGEEIEIINEISFRAKGEIEKEVILVSSEVTPAYQVYALDRELMIKEKIEALLSRKKPRDLFDLYFILRRDDLRPMVKLSAEGREAIGALLEKLDKKEIETELKTLLPKSFWEVIKDLPAVLKRELG